MHLREPGLELGRANEVGPPELASEPPFVQPEEELLAGALVELVPVHARAELRAQRDEILVRRRPVDQGLPESPVERIIEVVGRRAASSETSDGLRTTAASRSRSRWSPASSSRGVDDAATETARTTLEGARPASVSRGRSSLSASNRSAS